MALWFPLYAQVTLAGSNFDTWLVVYRGTALNTLTRVTFSDNCGFNRGLLKTSCSIVYMQPATTYFFQVDGIGSGTVVIDVIPAQSNDLFSAAWTTFPATGTILAAGSETAEPLLSTGVAVGSTVWYRFKAPVASSYATVRGCLYGQGSAPFVCRTVYYIPVCSYCSRISVMMIDGIL